MPGNLDGREGTANHVVIVAHLLLRHALKGVPEQKEEMFLCFPLMER